MTQDESWLLAEKYHGKQTDGFLSDCARLSNGEPLAYIIGHIPFLDTTIFLVSKPLIPRTETEYWVQKAIEDIQMHSTDTPPARVHVLDLCAGSGCIGVAILHALPYTTVDFVEIDTQHHPTIRTNIEKNGISMERVRIFSGDLFEMITDTYDYILTNPPYIDVEAGTVETSVVAHEPHLALFGGTGGTELIERIIVESESHLTPKGVLYIEHEPSQENIIRDAVLKHNYTHSTETDQYGTKRYTRITRTPHEKVS